MEKKTKAQLSKPTTHVEGEKIGRRGKRLIKPDVIYPANPVFKNCTGVVLQYDQDIQPEYTK